MQEDHCWGVLTYFVWAGIPIAIVTTVLYFVIAHYRTGLKIKRLEKWSLLSKDKLIFHGTFGDIKSCPTTSPYVLKLGTFLRLAKIPYEIDKTDPFGPKGKLPWISYNGQHMGDSQFIIEFLEKKFETSIGSCYSEVEKAIGTAVRVMLEEHVYWGGVQWSFVYEGRDKFSKAMFGGKLSFPKWLLFCFIASRMKSMAWSQGIGRHTKEEVKNLMYKDIRAISKILGRKKYILGDEMCTDDCAIFGLLAVDYFNGNSFFQDILDGECKNIKEYLIRMKNELWPEWNPDI